MNIPKLWASATREVQKPHRNALALDRPTLELRAWGWSLTDQAEAQRLADEKLERMAAAVAEGRELRHDYEYAARVLREEIIEELRDRSGELAAVITRNRYGAQVLNTANVFFGDVDLPEPPRPGLLQRLFGGAQPKADDPLPKVRATLAAQPGGRFRIYRTAAGYRVLALHALFDPNSAQTQDLLNALGADRLFARLCQAQRSFRARLTPKPWRCGASAYHVPFPRETQAHEDAHHKWLQQYEARCTGKATCQLVEEVGDGPAEPLARWIAELHDRHTEAESGMPLA